MEISSTFSIPDITDGLMRQAVTLSKFADLSYVACDKFSLISHCVAVEASFCLGRDVIGWRQSKTTRMTPHKKVPVRLYARANNRISVGDDPAFDTMNTENASEMNWEAEERQLHRRPRCATFWRCGRAAKAYILHRMNLALIANRWLPYDTCHIRKRLSKHRGNFWNLMARLHLNCGKDHIYHLLGLQRTSLQDKLK